jgi:hypothetical protein
MKELKGKENQFSLGFLCDILITNVHQSVNSLYKIEFYLIEEQLSKMWKTLFPYKPNPVFSSSFINQL